MRIANTVGDPQVSGAFDMRQGRIDILGRRFTFVSGRLTFAGDLMPAVDFVATTSTVDAVVELRVSGTAADPRISLSSAPELPEEEILSRLLFDSGVSSLSPLQAAQLIDAAAQLTGIVQGGGLLARVRQATGLDDLDIRQNAAGQTTIGASRRINDNVRVGVEATPDGQGGRVTIDLNLTPNLKARGEAGADGQGRVGVTIEREY